ncbi:hypothetical protein ACIOJ9_39430 [Streptomyces sp. NPDC088175]|uniref:hypothetical protein n=1 Tax=unclassified Streptomyces TaxID=2593676 RepID=UPI0037F3527B
MTTNSTPQVTAPGSTGTRLAPAGKAWDAVCVSRFLGLQTVERLGTAAGPVIIDPAGRTMYFLVPPGTSRAWTVPQTTALGEATHVVLPPERKQSPPGLYWLMPLSRPLTSASALHQALTAVQGPRPDPRPREPRDLAQLTFGQAQGWNCALCGARLIADRSLGMFTHHGGLITEPTELWACAPACRNAPGS